MPNDHNLSAAQTKVGLHANLSATAQNRLQEIISWKSWTKTIVLKYTFCVRFCCFSNTKHNAIVVVYFMKINCNKMLIFKTNASLYFR